MTEPRAADLHWIQVEEFVDIFNRIYISYDNSWENGFEVKRYASKWIPGDDIAGSGGPPVILSNEEVQAQYELKQKLADSFYMSEDTKEEMLPMVSFIDNPMYPFSVSAVTSISVCLFQPDRRWSVSRISDEPRDVCVADYMTRGDRLSACMKYPVGVGFVVLRMDGLGKRVRRFDVGSLEAASDNIAYSNSNSAVLKLMPGAYVLVPFTDSIMGTIHEYTLICSYKSGAIDFELDDILDQGSIKAANKRDKDRKKMETKSVLKSQSSAMSGPPGSPQSGLHQSSRAETPPLSPPPSVLIADAVQMSKVGRNTSSGEEVNIPEPYACAEWEWKEDSEDMGMSAVYDQVLITLYYPL